MAVVLAPISGKVLPLAHVPDPVFAAEMVGSGAAIEPDMASPGPVTAIAPISGRLMKTFPHAYVISGETLDVLIHLGLETTAFNGAGFDVVGHEGEDVEAGQEIVTWDPAAVAARGLSPLVLVCVLGTPPGSIDPGVAGRAVEAGSDFFELPVI